MGSLGRSLLPIFKVVSYLSVSEGSEVLRPQPDFRGVILTTGRKATCRVLVPSFQMTLPGAERAVVDVEKLRDYCLNPEHSRGRHKARVFASALRLYREDAEWLKAKLLNAALRSDSVKVEEDEYGYRYVLDFECERNDTSVIIRSGWIVRRGEDFPRLITCYVLPE